jgi:hypothetical protein
MPLYDPPARHRLVAAPPAGHLSSGSELRHRDRGRRARRAPRSRGASMLLGLGVRLVILTPSKCSRPCINEMADDDRRSACSSAAGLARRPSRSASTTSPSRRGLGPGRSVRAARPGRRGRWWRLSLPRKSRLRMRARGLVVGEQARTELGARPRFQTGARTSAASIAARMRGRKSRSRAISATGCGSSSEGPLGSGSGTTVRRRSGRRERGRSASRPLPRQHALHRHRPRRRVTASAGGEPRPRSSRSFRAASARS